MFFTGSKESVKAECERFIRKENLASDSLQKFAGQYKQDSWLYHTIFHIFEKAGVKGTYIDLASAFPRVDSNSFFFDLCLGWEGLCIEGDPEKAKNFKQSIRTCDFEEMCISHNVGKQKFVSNLASGMSSVVAGNKKNSTRGEIIEVNCGPLGPLLERHNIHHVDFMSLDIEGFEFQAMSTVDFSKVRIDIMIVEGANKGTPIHELLVKNGFIGMGLLALDGFNSPIDDVFVHHDSIWYKYCTWERGYRTKAEYVAEKVKHRHAWPRNCDFSQIERELEAQNQYNLKS
jgi:FkbM family methyltransferase